MEKGGEGKVSQSSRRASIPFVGEVEEVGEVLDVHDTGPSPESVPGLSSSEAVSVAGLSKSHLSLEGLLSLKCRSEEGRGESAPWGRDQRR